MKKILLIFLGILICMFNLSFTQKASVDYLIKNLKEGNDRQKIMAANELGKQKEESAVPALREALHDSNKKVREAVIEALIKIPGKPSLLALCKATEDVIPSNRSLAIKGLVNKYIPAPQSKIKKIFSKIQDIFRLQNEQDMVEPWVKIEPEVKQALINRLYDQKSVSMEAINAVHLLRTKEAIPDLTKLIKGDEDIIIEVLKTLADFRAATAGENIIPLLISKKDKIVAHACYCLGKIQYKPAISHLIQLYNYSSDIKYQKYALIGLSMLAAKEAENLFLKNIKSDDPEFRIASAEGLARIAEQKYTEEIARQFLNEKNEEVKLAMDFALFKLKRKEHMMNIIKSIEVYSDNVSAYIIECGEEGFAEISRYMPNLDKKVKIKLIKIMALSYNPSAIKYIEPYLNDSDIDVATASFESIKKLKKIEEMKLTNES